MNIQLILVVAFGGAIGSVARYLVSVGSTKLFGPEFPWGTLAINIVGSFALGVLVEWFALRWSPPEAARVFLTIGICGGFTTFSTFSLDSVFLLQRGGTVQAIAYVVSSVALSIGALFAGLRLVRAVL